MHRQTKISGGYSVLLTLPWFVVKTALLLPMTMPASHSLPALIFAAQPTVAVTLNSICKPVYAIGIPILVNFQR
jgi:hypothetical protein